MGGHRADSIRRCDKSINDYTEQADGIWRHVPEPDLVRARQGGRQSEWADALSIRKSPEPGEAVVVRRAKRAMVPRLKFHFRLE